MDMKDLNKPQMILLTLLVCFVVSVATGIVTVSLMQKMPKSVPQTVNNIIQRTIEHVSDPAPQQKTENISKTIGEALVDIYSPEGTVNVEVPTDATTNTNLATTSVDGIPLGQGVIVSDMGLILVDSTILSTSDTYRVKLDSKFFEAKILKKFGNGFTILQIVQKGKEVTAKPQAPTAQAIDSKQ